MKKILLCSIYCLFMISGYSQNTTSFWKDATPATMRNQTATRWITPQKYRALQLDRLGFENLLRRAPSPNSRNKETLTIAIPMPDGSSQRFAIKTTATLHPALAAKYPGLQTYSGKGISDPATTIHLDMTPQGFHGMILSPNGTVFIDPYYKNRDDYYVCYYKKDFVPKEKVKHACEVKTNNIHNHLIQDESIKKATPIKLGTARMATISMRTYRIAVGTNSTYTSFHGGTVQGGLAAVMTAINRVKGVYEDELAVSFQLVADNDKVIFTSSNDPYSNNSNSIDQNAGVLNNAIGNANYDIGHVFTTGSGGLAGLGVVCSSQKSAGTTGLGQPTGDPFHIDFVAHEIGHQFGGNHTFNGDSGSCSGGNRNRSTAYEPGSGSTIQAYAGICGNDNLQDNSDAYFHLVSLNEMRAHVTQESGANCGTLGNQNNTTPEANANAESINGKSIPANTPFELTGAATDANGDGLIYSWEQWNLGNQSDVNSPASGAPLFRSFQPTTSPTRIFPKLQDVLNNTTSVGEILPSGARILNFQFIARDDNTAGGFDADMIELTVVNGTGPFKINTPNSATTLSGTTSITWDVAGTNNSPISCTQVDIFLSLDGGQTFTQQLADNVSNNGAANITLPNVNISTARLKIKCADNVFLDINDVNFTIEPSSANPCTITDLTAGTTSACDMSTGRYTQEITVTYTDAPNTGSLVVNNQNFDITSSPQTITLINLIANGNTINTTANFSANTTCSRTANNLFQAPASCIPVCAITDITAGMQTACNASTNNYTQEITVTYENAPANSTLVVNNQTFTITNSPQTITLTGLIADGNNVTVNANFSTNTDCTNTVANLFQAPTSCTPICSITNITTSTQTACNPVNNTYTQAVTVTYINPPASGNLVVNNQQFSLTSSPQTVILINLNANSNSVDVTAFFVTDQNCTFTKNDLFTAPAACVTDLCQEYDATGLPIAISASGRPKITSTINVEQGGIITDINIKNLKGDHTFIYDLDFSLTSPNGTKVLFFSEACFGETQDFNLNIDDSGTTNNCQLTAGNTYLPLRSLAAFNGEEASGNWVLTVKDFFNLDGGNLDEWTLEICTVAGSSDCNLSSSNDTPINIPYPTGFEEVSITSTINITETEEIAAINIKNLTGTHDIASNLKMELTSPMGTSIILATQNCSFAESFDLNLDDTGMTLSCPLTGGNTYSPIGSLADFNGEIPTGNWVLTITDIDGFSEGRLTGWALEICTSSPTTTPSVNDNPILSDTYTSCESITSTGTVASNTAVIFQAGDFILLSPGFTAEAGCNFTVQIASCSSTIPQEETVTINQRTPILKRPDIDKTQWRQASMNLEVSPNPFKQQTTIKYQLPNATQLAIQLKDINGKLIQEVLPPSFQQAGAYQVTLNAAIFPSGVYFLQLQTKETITTKKVVIQQ